MVLLCSNNSSLKHILVTEGHQNSSTARVAIPTLLVGTLFVVGWLGGRYGEGVWRTIRTATIDSYINRYRVMSDSGLDSIVYYVSTKDSSSLYALAEKSPEILEVADTKITDLYDVRINYQARVAVVKTLRSMSHIDAVITVPLICH